MNTNLKVALSAIAIAVAASPVMAKSASHGHYVPSASIWNTYGSAADTRTAPAIEGNRSYVNDAVHVPFPQQGD
jgi:hypothetical protein